MCHDFFLVNFRSKISERWDLYFPRVFWRRGILFHFKGLVISRHKSLSLTLLEILGFATKICVVA